MPTMELMSIPWSRRQSMRARRGSNLNGGNVGAVVIVWSRIGWSYGSKKGPNAPVPRVMLLLRKVVVIAFVSI